MKPLKDFGPAVVINLKDRSDRRAYIESTFAEYEIDNYSFFEAYDARHLDGQYKMTGGQIGCSMSHLLAIKEWYLGGGEPFLIVLEDDISLDNSKYWSWTWSDFIDAISFEFDVMHLSTWALDLGMPEDLSPVKRGPDDLRLLTSCYIISRNGAKQVLEKTIGIDESRDLDFNDSENIADHRLIYGNVDKYYVLPMFSPNTEFISDITEDPGVARLQRMAAEHTSWLWRHNIRSIEEITQVSE